MWSRTTYAIPTSPLYQGVVKKTLIASACFRGILDKILDKITFATRLLREPIDFNGICGVQESTVKSTNGHYFLLKNML